MVVPSPVLAAAMDRLELLDRRELPMLAAHWVADGLGGPVVAALAGRARCDPDLDLLWPPAAAELGVALPVPQARRHLLAWAAASVVSGERTLDWLIRAFYPSRLDVQDVDPDVDTLIYCIEDALEWAPPALEGLLRDGRADPAAPDLRRQADARNALRAVHSAVQAMAAGDLPAALAAVTRKV